MTTPTLNELTQQALSLDLPERIALAQCLWESLEDHQPPTDTDEELRAELRERMRDEPDEAWKAHGDVMAAAQQEFGCSK